MTEQPTSANLNTSLNEEIGNRLGVLPNFFRLAEESPGVRENLWGFAKVGYLDNPLPPLFKERLFVYMSRFCDIRYCIARHVGFLIGLGHPAGDASCRTETVDQAIRLIRRPFPRGEAIQPYVEILKANDSPLSRLPDTDSPLEEAVFACATHLFLQTSQSSICLDALAHAIEDALFQQLLVFLAFVRTAHFWTKVHPELEFEDDLKNLFTIHEELAECVLNDPEAASSEVSQLLLDELAVLRRERILREEVERANERLREADRRKDTFLATLAHELRNPLAPIRTGLEIMKLSKNDPERLEEVRATMEQQTKQLTSLIDDLLDVSRITTGKFQLRTSLVELADVIQSAVEATRPFIDEAQHEFSLNIPHQKICLNADPHRLAQVISNLLNNAAKYTPEEGRICLSVEQEANEVVISVRDNGIGIPNERLHDIFDMFSQIDSPSERVQQGLGIGLTLVKTLVEMHEGTISVESGGVNQGSEFIVRLPTYPENVSRNQVLESPDDPGRKSRRVLIVDDNQAAANMLAIVVKLLGNDVCMAGNGQEAIEKAADFLPELILMDIGMPIMNGYDAATRIREQEWGKEMLLVALTGWGQEEDKQKTLDAGFNYHIVKPAEPEELKQLFAELDQKSC